MKCRICGKELIEGSKFCSCCGTKIEDEKANEIIEKQYEKPIKNVKRHDKVYVFNLISNIIMIVLGSFGLIGPFINMGINSHYGSKEGNLITLLIELFNYDAYYVPTGAELFFKNFNNVFGLILVLASIVFSVLLLINSIKSLVKGVASKFSSFLAFINFFIYMILISLVGFEGFTPNGIFVFYVLYAIFKVVIDTILMKEKVSARVIRLIGFGFTMITMMIFTSLDFENYVGIDSFIFYTFNNVEGKITMLMPGLLFSIGAIITCLFLSSVLFNIKRKIGSVLGFVAGGFLLIVTLMINVCGIKTGIYLPSDSYTVPFIFAIISSIFNVLAIKLNK